MAADDGQQVEPFCYEEQKANQEIVEDANEFEQALNGHVDPWLNLAGNLVMASAAAVPLSIGLGLAIGFLLPLPPDATVYASAIVGTLPAFAVLAVVAFVRTASLGHGIFVKQSKGLELTCERLRAVLDKTATCLEYDRKIGRDGLDRPNGSAITAATALCGLRMKALLLFQRAFRRLNLLREFCANLHRQSLIIAVGLPALAAICAIFFAWGRLTAPGNAELHLQPEHWGLAAAVTVAAYFPFFLANGFRAKVLRCFSNVLTEHWQIMPSDFDSTGPIMKQYEKTLNDLATCENERRWTPAQLRSMRHRDGAAGIQPAPIDPDKDEKDDRN